MESIIKPVVECVNNQCVETLISETNIIDQSVNASITVSYMLTDTVMNIPMFYVVGCLIALAFMTKFIMGPSDRCVKTFSHSDAPNETSTQTSNQTSSQTVTQEPDELIVIGVTGRKRSGKDTVGRYLVDNYGFVRVAYADALKEACKIIFGFSDDQVYGDVLKEIEDEYWKHSPREVLQKVGTELFRDRLPQICNNISNDIWIRSVDRQIQNLRKKGYTRFVITDVRFPNELEFIAKYKGQSWKVQRPGIVFDSSIPVHASEALIDDFNCDHIFVNDGTLEDLFDIVDVVMDKIIDPDSVMTQSSQ